MSTPNYERRPRNTRSLIRFDEGLRKRAGGVDLAALRKFVRRLNREPALRGQHFDVTLVDDAKIAALNTRFRGKPGPTDVLSFPFQDERSLPGGGPDFEGFIGDIVVSIEIARRSAAAERHSLGTELCQLILHGALHLAGYDHETDHGEMNELELTLRQRLQIEGGRDRERHRARRGKGAERDSSSLNSSE